MHAFS